MASTRSRFCRRKCTTPRHSAQLRLERLEDRFVPAVPANEAYIASLYEAFLGRSAEPGGLANWNAQLNAGVSRAQVALGIENSAEAISRTVQIYYQVFLGRPAETGGLNGWVQSVEHGASLEVVKANILGSNEFFLKSGATVPSYLNAVYENEIGRPIDSVALATWIPIASSSIAGRANAAFGIMRSAEGEKAEITSIYETVLGRLAEASGEAGWVSLLQHGVSDAQVIAGIIGSNEYFATILPLAAIAIDPNAVSYSLVVNMNRFDVTRPGAEQLNALLVT
jgi:hypothetical protein